MPYRPPMAGEDSPSTTWMRTASTKLMRGFRLGRERSTKERAKSVDIGRPGSPTVWKRLSVRKSPLDGQHHLVGATASLTLEDNPTSTSDNADTIGSRGRFARFGSWRKSLSIRRRTKNARLTPAPPTPPLDPRIQRTTSLH